MSKLPTPRDAAYHILYLFVEHFNSRAGHVLRTNNFVLPFNEVPWQWSDFIAGLDFGVEQGWLEVQRGGQGIRLTESGFENAGEYAVDLFDECNEKITIESRDGSLRENVDGLVTGKMVLVPDSSIPIAPGDAILRRLPSGVIERLMVSDPGFKAANEGMPPHYQVSYFREGQQPEGTPGHTIHVSGSNARVNINSIDHSTNVVNFIAENMDGLATDLELLKQALVAKATTPEHYMAIGNIASAETAAKAGDTPKVNQALSALGAAGKWAFDVAKEIGVPVAVEALKKAVGL
ncbi:hypothetical protein ELI03_14160 [Rhizobium leguminosarum]|uniref:Uncharacterized protein n=1 Tax=Rhizobium leguminosarum TaxID=384 RepID=A0A4Q8Y0J2_RHILE|nr:hypothetical protein [Rhizobium leguminosarum]TAX72810.1 hypothetical protein ELI03_14160 [Rhizobium leguminosarum]